jgi:glutamyl-tRNA(Gln) amidotransferase subunit E
VKAGLEVHQQLATGKLFCACPSELSDEVRGSFVRVLRAASGEDRALDPAAAFQSARGLRYRYEASESDCLVEMDEEPPHPINGPALDAALTLALLVHADWVDEVQVMRKIVVDGSNTTGFQRTAMVAHDGYLELGGKRVTIETICLEEDSARKVREGSEEVVYRLDRLGIPLVEVATGPEITSGAQAREVAQEIGALLRATRRVRRGLGTIREDVNVSVEGGHRTEIKGVQELGKIELYVDTEVARQRVLLAVRDALVRAGASVPDRAPTELTDLVDGVAAGPLAEVGRSGARVWTIPLLGFAGHLRSPPDSGERLGRELADQARAMGLRGLVHSDELPAFGLTEGSVLSIRERLSIGERDAFVLVVDRSSERAHAVLRRIADRARVALEGIPGETRDPLIDGRTRYSRPLPGRDRMYPETDVPPILLDPARRARLERDLPERPTALRARLEREHGLSAEVVRQIVYSEQEPLFEELTAGGPPAALVVRLLYQDLPSVPLSAPNSPPFEPSVELLRGTLAAVTSGRMAKEGMPAVLRALAEGAPDVERAMERAGLSGFTSDELDALVDRVVRSNQELVRTKGDAAFSPLMGDVMREVRGRRDGQEVADALRRSIARWIETTAA